MTRGEYVRHPDFPHLPPHVPVAYSHMMLACLSQHPEDRPPLDSIQQSLAEMCAQAAQPHGARQVCPPALCHHQPYTPTSQAHA